MSLRGKRILVTRAHHQAGSLAAALEEQGAEVLRIPTIEIIPPESYAHLDSLLEKISVFQWLILTSTNAVAAVADRLNFLRIPRKQLGHLRVAAVGRATAKAAGEIGLQVQRVPEEYVAEAVVAMLRDEVAGQRVLLARAAIARDVIPEELRRCGADIHVVEAYRTVIPPASIAAVRELFGPGGARPDAITLTSSSTVTNFLALLSAAGLDLPVDLPAVSIGPVTSATLRAHGWEPAQQAIHYDIAGLVAACGRLFASPEL